MSQSHTDSELQARLKQVLKDHQRDGLSMIGNVDKLVASLVRAIDEWLAEEKAARKSA